MSDLLTEACIRIAQLEQLTGELQQRIESLERSQRSHYGSNLHEQVGTGERSG